MSQHQGALLHRVDRLVLVHLVRQLVRAGRRRPQRESGEEDRGEPGPAKEVPGAGSVVLPVGGHSLPPPRLTAKLSDMNRGSETLLVAVSIETYSLKS